MAMPTARFSSRARDASSDGDAILLIAAAGVRRTAGLPGNVVVATVMSNLGLEKALAR